MARSGGDKRGSASDRAARKLWLLGAIPDRNLGYAPFGGDGTKVPCVFCGALLGYTEVEADRIVAGGSYARTNVQPACRACNLARSDDDISAAEVAARVEATIARKGRALQKVGPVGNLS